ncbi:MAG: hydroxyisourate hydrolase [Pseudomonadota bacterium]
MSQITTHVLDTSKGSPGENIRVELYVRNSAQWSLLASDTTNSDGRIDSWSLPEPLAAGVYKQRFYTRDYFASQNTSTFYPEIDVQFEISGDGQHYHVPLLLNPFGYSTYRGS